MSKYTPGPWNVRERTLGNQYVIGADTNNDGPICHTMRNTGHDHTGLTAKETNYDNAALIAAAPDLLTACELALEDIEFIGGDPVTARILRAAIAKAEGVTP